MLKQWFSSSRNISNKCLMTIYSLAAGVQINLIITLTPKQESLKDIKKCLKIFDFLKISEN